MSRNLIEQREGALSRDLGPTVEERRQKLIEFYRLYEEFVELLCDAAQYGTPDRFSADYVKFKARFDAEYPEARSFIAAFLPPDELEGFRFEKGRPRDAFEQLFGYATIHEFLSNDDGSMIQRITSTREALNLYGHHLRQLAARSA